MKLTLGSVIFCLYAQNQIQGFMINFSRTVSSTKNFQIQPDSKIIHHKGIWRIIGSSSEKLTGSHRESLIAILAAKCDKTTS